jgi:hypothetical protein
VALRKIVTAPAYAGLLLALGFPCACNDLRPVGTVTLDAGDRPDGGSGPIQVLVWNTALTYVHLARAKAIPLLQARELTDNLRFDTTYAHLTSPPDDGPTDTTFDASVFTDQGLDKYDVVLFLNTTGNTIDDDKRAVGSSERIRRRTRTSPARPIPGPGMSILSEPTTASCTPARARRASQPTTWA